MYLMICNKIHFTICNVGLLVHNLNLTLITLILVYLYQFTFHLCFNYFRLHYMTDNDLTFFSGFHGAIIFLIGEDGSRVPPLVGLCPLTT